LMLAMSMVLWFEDNQMYPGDLLKAGW